MHLLHLGISKRIRGGEACFFFKACKRISLSHGKRPQKRVEFTSSFDPQDLAIEVSRLANAYSRNRALSLFRDTHGLDEDSVRTSFFVKPGDSTCNRFLTINVGSHKPILKPTSRMRAMCSTLDVSARGDSQQERQPETRRAQSTINPFSIGEYGERVFIIDSGASTHLISRDWLTEAEQRTIHKAPRKLKVITANGEIELRDQICLTLHSFDIAFKAYANPGRTAVLSLGALCHNFGMQFSWAHTQLPI